MTAATTDPVRHLNLPTQPRQQHVYQTKPKAATIRPISRRGHNKRSLRIPPPPTFNLKTTARQYRPAHTTTIMSRQAADVRSSSAPTPGSSSGGRPASGMASTSGSAEPDTRRPGTGSSDTTPPKPKVDVSHFPHYGLKRGMACTFCRRRKLRCSGDRPSCTNCVKYSKACEYGPPVKDPKKQTRKSPVPGYAVSSMVPPQGRLSVPPLPQMPMFPSQASSTGMQMEYGRGHGHGHGPSPVFAEQHTMTTGGYVTQGSISPFQEPAFDPFMQQQGGYHTPPVPQTVPILQHAQFAQALPQQTFSLPQFAPQGGSGMTQYPGTAQWTHPSTPSLQHTSPGYITPLHGSGGVLSDPYTGETLFDPNVSPSENMVTSTSMVTAFPFTSEQSSPDEIQSALYSSSDSGGAYSPNSLASKLYLQTPSLHYVADVDVVEGLTSRLGEFLFNPAVEGEGSALKRRKSERVASGSNITDPGSSPRPGSAVARNEYDGLAEPTRSLLVDTFLTHSNLFFELSVSRLRYRLTFSDKRRPSLALLNAMYLWATRISEGGSNTTMEKHFFDQANKHLHVSVATTDRLLDAVRAAYLLSCYSFLSARHHEGWCIAGVAVRLVLSCGLHRIRSCTLKAEPDQSPFLRNRAYLLPAPEDTVELAERIHAFWAVFAIDRCGALCTGYPAALRDEDISTPFPLSFSDIASGVTTERDDRSVRDLYLGQASGGLPDTVRTRWMKCTTILERSSKIIFLEPEKDSPYQTAWNQYTLSFQQEGSQAPPEYLNQAKFRSPKEYQECILAIDQVIKRNGDDGIFPPTRRAVAQADRAPEPEIPSSIVMFHHMVSAVQMILHDIDSLTAENTEALKAARKSVQLFQIMPQIPFTDVDAFIIQVWFMIGKTLVKEVNRLSNLGDMDSARGVATEVDTVQSEIARIGQSMHLAKTQAAALEELKLIALEPPKVATVGLNLDNFLFPQHMI